MTKEEREKAIKALKWFKEYNEEDYCGGDRIQDEHGDWYYRITEQDFETFNMIIKALEQEPILDKIRAEISALKSHHINDCYDDGFQGCRTNVLHILDKCKVESEDKE